MVFVILGLLLTGVVWSLTNRSVASVVRLPMGLALLVAAGVYGYFESGSVVLAPESWYDTTPFKELILFFVMVLGMVARSVSAAIERRKDAATAASGLFGLPLDLWDIVYPLLFSVVTFGALVGQVGSEALSVPGLVMSFQTGFFWQTLLKEK